MSEPNLGPTTSSPKPLPKGQLVTLGIPMFVLEARFTAPTASLARFPGTAGSFIEDTGPSGGYVPWDDDEPSPPPAPAPPPSAIVGTQSDSAGVSAIPFRAVLNDTTKSWYLALQPVFDDATTLDEWKSHGAASSFRCAASARPARAGARFAARAGWSIAGSVPYWRRTTKRKAHHCGVRPMPPTPVLSAKGVVSG